MTSRSRDAPQVVTSWRVSQLCSPVRGGDSGREEEEAAPEFAGCVYLFSHPLALDFLPSFRRRALEKREREEKEEGGRRRRAMANHGDEELACLAAAPKTP